MNEIDDSRLPSPLGARFGGGIREKGSMEKEKDVLKNVCGFFKIAVNIIEKHKNTIK